MARICLGPAMLLVTVVAEMPHGPVGHGYRSSKKLLPRVPVVHGPTGEELMADRDLPKSWDWRNVKGRSFVTSDVNQHIPQYCGSCWIHGTTAALNDRIKVMRNAEWPDVMLARQVLINCVPAPGDNSSEPPPGCNGGDPWMIHKYLLHNKVGDETCLPYQARNMGCEADTVCRNCAPGGFGFGPVDTCFPIKHFTGFGVQQYGNVKGEEHMKREIYARGPIVCSAATDAAFLVNYSENALLHEGVYVTDKVYNETDVDHNIEVTGWGETQNGIKYWVVRNSWGTYWGDMGWFKVRRGVNQMLIEADCDWAVPEIGDITVALHGKVMGDYIRGVQPTAFFAAPENLPAAESFIAGDTASTSEATTHKVAVFMFIWGFLSALALVAIVSRLPAAPRWLSGSFEQSHQPRGFFLMSD